MAFKPEKATDLGGLADVLGELAQVPSRAAAAIAEDFNGMIEESFEEQTDPYGEPWEALEDSTVLKKGHARILYELGELSESARAVPRKGAGIELLSAGHGFFHQAGTVHHPARRFFPDEGLPSSWQERIDARVSETFAKTLKGRRRA